MKIPARTLLLAVLATLALGVPASAAPPTISPIDVKAALKKASDAALVDFHRQFPLLTFEDPCAREYNDAVKAAETEAKDCLDAANPPAGSPLANFNALSNAQLASFCGAKTLDACVADVVKAQQRFCAINAAKAKARARTAQQKCCSGFAAKKKQLEADLKNINDRLAICLGN